MHGQGRAALQNVTQPTCETCGMVEVKFYGAKCLRVLVVNGMRGFGKFLVISVIMQYVCDVLCMYAIKVGCHPHQHVSYVFY